MEGHDLAKDVWHAATGLVAKVGMVSIPLQQHAGQVIQVAETAPPVNWLVVKYTCGLAKEIYTFAEAKPWQVSHPDLFLDILRLQADNSTGNTPP